MPGPNGQSPAEVPLNLTPAERKAALVSCGLGDGWLLLTREEMLTMRRQMMGMARENDLIRAELRRRIGKEAVKVLKKIVDGADKFVPFPPAPAVRPEPEKPPQS